MTALSKAGTKLFLSFAIPALLAGCAMGPDFKKPAAPPAEALSLGALPTATNASGKTTITDSDPQRLVTGQDIAGDWWTLFHSQPLNDLVERSLKANPGLKAAQAALLMAHENVMVQNGSYYPSAAASFSASRQKTSSQIAPVPDDNNLYFNLYTPQVSVAYTPDVFGLNRRTVESLQAQKEQARFALIATHITLSANVVAAAIQAASLKEQIAATHELIAINTNMLQILRAQFSKGYASRLEVAAQEAQLAQILATLPPLLKQLAQQRDLIAVLSGGFPGQNQTNDFDLSQLQLPLDLPVSLPSKIVAQRPDVRQAEENLHAASALIGVAAANRLPNITLSGDVGAMALQFGQMFAGGAGFWTLAGSVTQPIFEGGALMHKERAARAAYTQAAEQYRGAVLTAFQNVADTLAALEQDGDALNSALAARDAAKTTLDLSQRQWQSGYANYLTLLGAQQGYNQAAILLVQARANRYADTAALFQALGGGWWNRTELAKN